jgi:hypothetical protein
MASMPYQNPGSWKTPSRLLKCNTKNCRGSSSTSEEHCTSFSIAANIRAPFLADITCGACHDSFSVCIECPRTTTQLRTEDQIKRHCRNAHEDNFELVWRRNNYRNSLPNGAVQPSTNRRRSLPLPAEVHETEAVDDISSQENSLILDGENEFANNGMEFSDSDEAAIPDIPEVTVTPVLRQSDIGLGCRENNAAYFYKESKVEGGGLDYLVGMAAFQVPDLDHGTLKKDEVSMYANTAAFASKLSQPNRDRFALLTKQICDVVKKQTLEEVEVSAGRCERRPFLIEPLQTPNDIRMQFFDQEKSLFNLLPHPPLFECEGHTYSL